MRHTAAGIDCVWPAGSYWACPAAPALSPSFRTSIRRWWTAPRAGRLPSARTGGERRRMQQQQQQLTVGMETHPPLFDVETSHYSRTLMSSTIDTISHFEFDVYNSQRVSDVISSFHIYVSCFAAILWGKQFKISVTDIFPSLF